MRIPASLPRCRSTTEIEVDGWTVAAHGPGRRRAVRRRRSRAGRRDQDPALRGRPPQPLSRGAARPLSQPGSALCLDAVRADRPAVAARLILVDIVTAEERDEEVRVDAGFGRGLAAAAGPPAGLGRTPAARTGSSPARAAEPLPFPHAEPAAGAGEIGDAVTGALEQGRHLLLRAPPAAARQPPCSTRRCRPPWPAVRGSSSSPPRPCSSRSRWTPPRRCRRGLFRSLQLRAKSKMCANTEMVCHEEFCPYAREYGLKLVRTRLAAQPSRQDRRTRTRTRSTKRPAPTRSAPSKSASTCSPRSTWWCATTTTSSTRPSASARVLDGGALRDAVLVIDEAHNLVDRSREYYSPTCSIRRLSSGPAVPRKPGQRRLPHLLGARSRSSAELIARDRRATRSTRRPGRRRRRSVSTTTVFAELRIAFDGAMLQYFLYKRENELWMADDPVMDVFLALTRFHRVLGLGGEEFVHLARRARPTASRSSRSSASTPPAFSARCSTRAPARWPCRPPSSRSTSTATCSASTPSHRRAPSCRHHSRPRTAWSVHRRTSTPPIAGGPRTTTASPRGSPASPIRTERRSPCSPATLSSTRCATGCQRHRTHRHRPEPGSTDAAQREILEALASGDPHLVLAVLGGIFAEGVDYPGDMLSQVIVVSPGLPAVQHRAGAAQGLLPGVLRPRLRLCLPHPRSDPGGAGRRPSAPLATRTAASSCSSGRRFQDGRHARYLPQAWIDGDPMTMLHEDPEFSVRRFFDE